MPKGKKPEEPKAHLEVDKPQEALVPRPRSLPAHLDPQVVGFRIPTTAEWQGMLAFAKDLIDTGFLPATIKTPAQGALVMLKGQEVSLPAHDALGEINVIHGKTGLSARAMRYLLGRAGVKIEFPEHTNESATVKLTRPDGASMSLTFKMSDAAKMWTNEKQPNGQMKSVKLSDTSRYYQNAELMLMNRALSRGADQFCAEVLGGCRLQEEVESEAPAEINITPLPAVDVEQTKPVEPKKKGVAAALRQAAGEVPPSPGQVAEHFYGPEKEKPEPATPVVGNPDQPSLL